MDYSKKINLRLTGIDGNAFMLMGAFRDQAEKEGWTEEEIDVVMEQAMSSDYKHLVATLLKHCKS